MDIWITSSTAESQWIFELPHLHQYLNGYLNHLIYSRISINIWITSSTAESQWIFELPHLHQYLNGYLNHLIYSRISINIWMASSTAEFQLQDLHRPLSTAPTTLLRDSAICRLLIMNTLLTYLHTPHKAIRDRSIALAITSNIDDLDTAATDPWCCGQGYL